MARGVSTAVVFLLYTLVSVCVSLQCRDWSPWSSFSQRDACECGYQYRIRYCTAETATEVPQCRWYLERRQGERCDSYTPWGCGWWGGSCNWLTFRCCSDLDATVEQRTREYNTAAECLAPLDYLLDGGIVGLDDAYVNPQILLDDEATDSSGNRLNLHWYPENAVETGQQAGYTEEVYTEQQPAGPTGGAVFPALILDDGGNSGDDDDDKWFDFTG